MRRRLLFSLVIAGSLAGCFPRLDAERTDGPLGAAGEVDDGGWGEDGADSGRSDEDDGDEDADGGDAPVALEIAALVPAAGSTAGGETVRIAGGPFDDSAEVFLCGASGG
jgi:hypothetical protein